MQSVLALRRVALRNSANTNFYKKAHSSPSTWPVIRTRTRSFVRSLPNKISDMESFAPKEKEDESQKDIIFQMLFTRYVSVNLLFFIIFIIYSYTRQNLLCLVCIRLYAYAKQRSTSELWSGIAATAYALRNVILNILEQDIDRDRRCWDTYLRQQSGCSWRSRMIKDMTRRRIN
jgi:hypothetical protein